VKTTRRLAGFALSVVALLACKNPNEKACREGMIKVGIYDEPQKTEMCTKSCSYLVKTYGIGQEQCEYMQRGFTGPEPKTPK